MKRLFSIIVMGILAGITWKYLQENDIDVTAQTNRIIDLGKKNIEKVMDFSYDKASIHNLSGSKSESTHSPGISPPEPEPQDQNNAISTDERAAMVSTRVYTAKNHNRNEDVAVKKPLPTDENLPEEFDRLSNLDKVKLLTKIYSPDSWHLLMLYDELPANLNAKSSSGGIISSPKSTPTFHYINEGPVLRMLSRMSTNVHEIAHGYFSLRTFTYAEEKGILLNFKNAELMLFLSPDEEYFLSFPKNRLFPSKELAHDIPEHLQTFRYDTYIEGNTSTQSEGVLGLLNELYAYYLGSKSNYDMLKAFQIVEGCYETGLYAWVRNTQSSMTAFYEFDFFIREYLLRMHEHYPEHYHALTTHTRFMHAYASVYKAYSKLLRDYEARIHEQILTANTLKPGTFSIDEMTLWYNLQGGRTSQGTSLISPDRDKLLPILTSNRYESIGPGF